MSFRLFIYYCALCGAWAAFATWGLTSLLRHDMSITLKAMVIGGVLGALVGASVGMVDAILSAVGTKRLARVMVCALCGLFGGAIGGLIGQLLKTYLSVPLFIGWMIAGVLIGAGLGVYDILVAMNTGQDNRSAWRKTLHGIYGGLVGGLVGGLPSWLLEGTTFLPRSSALIGLVLLGGSIGLMIGLAQVILKEAWITVVEGFRAGRELILAREETTIGRAESCDLGLFADNSIDRLHARIVLKGNRYVLIHAGEHGQTLLNDKPVGSRAESLHSGDRIQIGKSVLSFGERHKKKKR